MLVEDDVSKQNSNKRQFSQEGSVGPRIIVVRGRGEESISHLFFECPIFAGTWCSICQWIGIKASFQNESVAHLQQLSGFLDSKIEASRVALIIWFACIWIIWKERNRKLFRNMDVCLDLVVENIKITS